MAARATSSGSPAETVIRPRGSNCQATAPLPASEPPDLTNIERTSAAVRLRLSVAAVRRLVDRPLDVLGGHVQGAGLLDRQPQPVVGIRIAAAGPGSHGDLASHLGEHLSLIHI